MKQKKMDKDSFIKKVMEDREELKKQEIQRRKALDIEYISYIREQTTKRLRRQRGGN